MWARFINKEPNHFRWLLLTTAPWGQTPWSTLSTTMFIHFRKKTCCTNRWAIIISEVWECWWISWKYSENVDGYHGRSDNVDGYYGRWTGSRKAGFRNKEAHQAVGDSGKGRLQTKRILVTENLQKSTLQILGWPSSHHPCRCCCSAESNLPSCLSWATSGRYCAKWSSNAYFLFLKD